MQVSVRLVSTGVGFAFQLIESYPASPQRGAGENVVPLGVPVDEPTATKVMSWLRGTDADDPVSPQDAYAPVQVGFDFRAHPSRSGVVDLEKLTDIKKALRGHLADRQSNAQLAQTAQSEPAVQGVRPVPQTPPVPTVQLRKPEGFFRVINPAAWLMYGLMSWLQNRRK